MNQNHDEDNPGKVAKAGGYLAAGVAANVVDAEVVGGD